MQDTANQTAAQASRTTEALYMLANRIIERISERDILKAPLKDKIRAATMLCDLAMEIEKNLKPLSAEKDNSTAPAPKTQPPKTTRKKKTITPE